MPQNYYVYVYIDPRNFQEFYYGKGIGNRKLAHLKDESDSKKAKTIREIKKEGLEPIIKVIVKDLTEREAFLIEKTLIWRLGKNLTNKSTGHFASKFRPHNTFHKEITGFDYGNDIYYINAGIDKTDNRIWDDYVKYGFIAAGQGEKWSEPVKSLELNDIIVVYIKNKGFAGVGKITQKAIPVKDFKLKEKPIQNYNLKSVGLFRNSDDVKKCDWVVGVKWIKTFEENKAKFEKKKGLFTTQLIKASLQNQQITKDYIEQEFNISFKKLLK